MSKLAQKFREELQSRPGYRQTEDLSEAEFTNLRTSSFLPQFIEENLSIRNGSLHCYSNPVNEGLIKVAAIKILANKGEILTIDDGDVAAVLTQSSVNLLPKEKIRLESIAKAILEIGYDNETNNFNKDHCKKHKDAAKTYLTYTKSRIDFHNEKKAAAERMQIRQWKTFSC